MSFKKWSISGWLNMQSKHIRIHCFPNANLLREGITINIKRPTSLPAPLWFTPSFIYPSTYGRLVHFGRLGLLSWSNSAATYYWLLRTVSNHMSISTTMSSTVCKCKLYLKYIICLRLRSHSSITSMRMGRLSPLMREYTRTVSNFLFIRFIYMTTDRFY
jgi:hypothetical protein